MRASPDDILGMAFFARVVEARSFSDAARALGVSKSAVSARVARLEARLGVTLLHRTTRRIALTADGVRLYERCARVVAEADEAAQIGEGASAEPRGLVRIQTPTALGADAMRVLGAFVRAHPAVRVELRSSDHTPDFGQLDLAIVLAERLADSGLTTRRLGPLEHVLCASKSYLIAHGIPFRPQDLVTHDCLAHSLWSVSLAAEDGPVGFARLARVVADDARVLHAAALDGAGIAMLPEPLVRDDVAVGRLHRVLDDFRTEAPSVLALHPHGRLVPATVRALLDHLAAGFRPSAPKPTRRVAEAASKPAVRGAFPMTAQDVRRLGAVAALYAEADAAGVARLRKTLARARPTAAAKIPRTTVTMNSRVRLRDAGSGERELSLAYPWDAGCDKTSVLGALGATLLGAKVGARLVVEGEPLTVAALPYQPEAAGDHHL